MKVISKRISALLLAVCVVMVSSARAADVDPYLPNDAEVVAQVNIRQLLDSPLVKQLALEHLKNLFKMNGEVETVFQQLGLDPFADLASVTVAGPAGMPLALSSADDLSQGVMIVHGKFDLAKFRARADDAAKEGDALKIIKTGDYTVYEVSALKNVPSAYVALADDRTIVASAKKDMVVDVLDKHAGKKQADINADLKARIEKHPRNETAWIVALSKGLGKSVVATDLTAKEFLEKSITLSSSLSVSKDVDIGAVIDAKNATDAAVLQKKLSDLIDQGKGILQVFAQSQKELAPLLDLANSLKVTADDKTVTLKGTIPNAVIEKAIKR